MQHKHISAPPRPPERSSADFEQVWSLTVSIFPSFTLEECCIWGAYCVERPLSFILWINTLNSCWNSLASLRKKNKTSQNTAKSQLLSTQIKKYSIRLWGIIKKIWNYTEEGKNSELKLKVEKVYKIIKLKINHHMKIPVKISSKVNFIWV